MADNIASQFTGLPIPANGEIVIEGEYLPPDVESRTEGPLGEWTGYYGGGERQEPVVQVKAVYYRNNPILAGAPPIKPPNYAFAVQVRTTPGQPQSARERPLKRQWKEKKFPKGSEEL